MQAYNFRPISHNETLFDARVYYPEMTTAGGRFYQEYMKIALRDVLLEDLSTLEHTQSACETRAKSHMQLQEHEIMVRHNAWVVDRMIREGEAAPS
jgi:phenylpropionate dioxygenase-like ring-hydroxylating dioxygenase large terminal subunit